MSRSLNVRAAQNPGGCCCHGGVCFHLESVNCVSAAAAAAFVFRCFVTRKLDCQGAAENGDSDLI